MNADDIEVIEANTPETLEIHYRIRFEVYCLERGFEPYDRFEQGMESDHYDKVAAHFIARSKRTGEWLGACRIVAGKIEDLPVSHHVRIDDIPQNPGWLGEVSRLCVVKSRAREAGHHESSVMLSLLSAARAWSLRHDLGELVLLTTESVSRLLARFKILLTRIGPSCLLNGRRSPFLFNLLAPLPEHLSWCKKTKIVPPASVVGLN